MNADMKRLCEAAHKCITEDHGGMEGADPSFAEAIVHAVLTALREPSEGMQKAALENVGCIGDHGEDARGWVDEEFSAMIDHVLSPEA